MVILRIHGSESNRMDFKLTGKEYNNADTSNYDIPDDIDIVVGKTIQLDNQSCILMNVQLLDQ